MTSGHIEFTEAEAEVAVALRRDPAELAAVGAAYRAGAERAARRARTQLGFTGDGSDADWAASDWERFLAGRFITPDFIYRLINLARAGQMMEIERIAERYEFLIYRESLADVDMGEPD